MVASCTPCERSVTSSLDGVRTAPIRRRMSSNAASGMSTRNGRIAVAPDFSVVADMWVSSGLVAPPRLLGGPARRTRENPWSAPRSAPFAS
jgi:hypothetical protein